MLAKEGGPAGITRAVARLGTGATRRGIGRNSLSDSDLELLISLECSSLLRLKLSASDSLEEELIARAVMVPAPCVRYALARFFLRLSVRFFLRARYWFKSLSSSPSNPSFSSSSIRMPRSDPRMLPRRPGFYFGAIYRSSMLLPSTLLTSL